MRPSLADLLVVAVLARMYLFGTGWQDLLGDGDTGWHIRAGDWILEHRSVPSADFFSFSRPGAPWFAWEWLSDVTLSLVHRSWGLPGVTLLCGCAVVAGIILLFRLMLFRGANLAAAFALLWSAINASAIHYLARPHLVTLVFLTVSLILIERDRRSPGAYVWLLAPLTVLWANLHGGFLALPASLLVLGAGYVLQGWLDSGARSTHFRAARRQFTLALAALGASLLNPYGIGLHLHIARYLTSDWIRNLVQEFQSPVFRSESMLHFELLLGAGWMTAAALLGRKRISEAALLLFWSHLAITSARHVPLFVVVCAPLVAGELSRLWETWAKRLPPRAVGRVLWDLGEDFGPSFKRISLWGPALAAGAIALTPSHKWPADFPESRFPTAIVRAEQSLLISARVLTSDQWADYLIYKGYPRQQVFFDGRSDFYGRELGDEYLRLMTGRRDWKELFRKYDFDAALLPVEWPLASLLDADPEWVRVREDRLGVLYVHAKHAPR